MDDEEKSEVTEKTFVVGRNQEYYKSDGVIRVGFVYYNSNEYKEGLRSGMSVTSADPIHDGKREITVITHVNSEPQGSDVSYGGEPQGSDVSYGGGKKKRRKYSKKSTKRKSKKKGSKKRRKSKKKTKRRR